MTARKISLLLATLFFLAVPSVRAHCFCSPTVYSSNISGNARSCSQLSANLTSGATYFADYYCSNMGFEASCNVQVELGPCTPNPISPGFIMSGTFDYRCVVCVDRDPPPHDY